MTTPRIDIPMEKLAEFCRRWKIMELSLFGSVLRDDFGPASDVDVLAVFADDGHWSAWDLMRAQRELSELLGRRVDLLERRAIEKHHNPWLRAFVLGQTQTVFAA